MKPSRSLLQRFLTGLILVVALLGIVLILMDWDQILDVLRQASWKPIPYALATTFVSYLCISFSFARVSRLLGIQMRLRDLTVVGFVTTILNHVVASGGAAGYTMRFMLMNRHGVSLREVIATSILHFYLTSLVMVAMLPVGLIYLLLNSPISQTAALLFGAVALILLLASLTATGLVFWSSLRKRVITILVTAARVLIRRDVAPLLERFDVTLAQGVAAIRKRPPSIVLIMLLIVVDWATSAMTLWFCLRAMGVAINLGELISGFVLGIMAGVASMIPGGLGVQEGSMAGVFALLGVPIEKAVLAAILFRAVYYLLPYGISLGFYWQLLPTRDQKARYQGTGG